MSIKERFARVWLATMVVTYAAYFAWVATAGETTFWTQIWAFAATVVVQVTVIGIASAMMELRHRGGPKADERDVAIDQRATRVAYHLLMVGMILVGCVMPFSESGWKLFHAAVLAIAVAEIVRHGLIVSLYRRGWHD
jgi:peptidoglycan/LPS O-acetylase OafA/YrhL